MLKRIADKRREDQGFTLIELLVVIVILGILAAVVVFAVGGITDKGDTAATNTDMKTVQTAEEAFFAKQTGTGVYATEAELVSGGFLAAQSTKHDVCLIQAVAGPPAVATKSAYKVIPQTTPATACPAGYSLTGA